jgi:hypothetical protein
LPASFTKRLLDTTTYPNAVCNDGTPAGYYPAAGAAGSQTWILFLEGGSWCSSDADCAGRGTALSSSSGWTSTISPSGIISGDAAQNPHFSAFNRVDVPYCTSDVFSGDAAASSAGKFQFRGRAVIDGVIADLKSTYGFGKPGSTVLLSGASAGGVSVLVTADRIAAALPGVKVVALTDAGFLPDVAPLTGPSILSQFQTAMTYWNGSPDDSCAAANPTEKQKCYLAQYAEPEITTPLFFGQNLEDPHGPLHAGGFTWPTTPTTAQKNWMNDVYTPAMERLLAATSSSTGFFSPCQVVHTMIDNSEWTTATVGSEHYDDAVNAFLNGTSVTRADKTPCSYP